MGSVKGQLDLGFRVSREIVEIFQLNIHVVKVEEGCVGMGDGCCDFH